MGAEERIVVEAGGDLPAVDWAWECAAMPEAWPYVAPIWLTATADVLPGARPMHSIARRGPDDLAVLPGFLLDVPAAVDIDPRTFLGWQPEDAEEEVCGGLEADAAVRAEVEALGQDAFFPALVIGSPFGYRSEPAYTFWTPTLFDQLVDGAIAAAHAHGARSVVAPWIPDRAGNERLVHAFMRHGGAATFWGREDYLALDAPGYDAHLAAMPARRRRRLKEDRERTAQAGVRIERLSRDELAALVPRVAQLTCMTREKNGTRERPEQVAGILRPLLAAGADLHCWVALAGDEVVGHCITMRKPERLFVKWVGFDYDRLGTRSGVYFTLVLDMPVREAFAHGARFVEVGTGAHESKALRGCRPRDLTTALWVADEGLRPQVGRLLGAFGERRRESFGLAPARSA